MVNLKEQIKINNEEQSTNNLTIIQKPTTKNNLALINNILKEPTINNNLKDFLINDIFEWNL